MSSDPRNPTLSRRAAIKAAATAISGAWAHPHLAAIPFQQPAGPRTPKPVHLAPEKSLDPAAHSRVENLFWTDLMMEHAAFFAMLMPGAGLAAQRAAAENFQRSFQHQFERVRSAQLDATNYPAFNRATVELIKPFIEYKRTMLAAQNAGKIQTLVFSTFFDHAAREAQRAALRLEKLAHGDVTLNYAEVVDFWTGIMSDHGELTAHLLDPSEQEMIGQTRDLSARFQGLREANRGSGAPGRQIVLATEELIDFETALEQGIEMGLVKNVIYPAFAQHMHRETLKFLDELKRSGSKT